MINCMKKISGLIAAAMLVFGMTSCEQNPETKYVDKTYVASVTFSSEDAGDAGVKVTMASATEGADIYYTTDGTDPTSTGTKYSAPVTFNADTTVKAIAIKTGMENSPVSVAAVSIKTKTVNVDKTYASSVTFSSEDAGDAGVKVTMASATEGADIYYTTDGTDPTSSGTKYSAPVTFNADTTVKAIAIKTGMENSPVSVVAVSIKTKTVNVEKYVCPKCFKTYDTAQKAADCCSVQTVEVEKIVNVYGKTETAASKVVHYKQNLNGNSYDFAEEESKAVEAGAAVTGFAKTYAGFNAIGFVENGSVLNVFYDRKEITLTYKINTEDESSYVVKKGLYGATAGTVADPTKSDHHFNYWTTDGSTEVTPATVFPAESATYIASWHQIVQYTITYTSKYGTALDAKTIYCHTAITEDYLPAMENQTINGVEYELSKWNMPDGTKCNAGIVLTADLNLTAVWLHKNFVEVTGGTVKGAAYSNNHPGVFPEGRTVTLSSFYMCKYEVTQAEYKSVMEGQKITVDGDEYTLDASPSKCTASNEACGIDKGKDHSNHPVENVTWYDAVWYCNALSEKAGLNPCYTITVKEVEDNHITDAVVVYENTKNGYRLPTEAEWEYAARGGDTTDKEWNYVFSGADTASGVNYMADANAGLDNVGWYSYNNITGTTGSEDVTAVTYEGNGMGTHEVGKKNANRLGLYDMSGNVYEWCYDWKGDISSETVTNPIGATAGLYRVMRGGGWYYSASSASVSWRGSTNSSNHTEMKGFRVCRNAN